MAVPIGNENNLKHPSTNNKVIAQLFSFSKPTPPIIEGIENRMMMNTAINLINGMIHTNTHSASGPASLAINGMIIEIKADTISNTIICKLPEIIYRMAKMRLCTSIILKF
jgi:hypothetical protein